MCHACALHAGLKPVRPPEGSMGVSAPRKRGWVIHIFYRPFQDVLTNGGVISGGF